MAKKKKRTNFQAPTKAQASESVTKAVDEVKDELDPPTEKKSGSRVAAAKADAEALGEELPTRPKGYTAPKGRATGAKTAAPSVKRRGMSSQASWRILGFGIAAIVIGVIVVATLLGRGGSGITEVLAWDLPARSGETDNGDEDGRILLSDFQGKPVVVNFFAGWCEACDEELPYFTEIGDQYKDQVEFVFVHANEGGGGWKGMAERHDIIGNFPIAEDVAGTNRNGLLRELGGDRGMPATAYYDANGNLVTFSNGIVSEGALLAGLQQLGVTL